MRRDSTQEQVYLQVDFFRLMRPRLTVTFPPLHGFHAAAAYPQETTQIESFVFYKGVAPFIMMGVSEQHGALDKFGPPAFFIRVSIFAVVGGGQAQTPGVEGLPRGHHHVLTRDYFCASQIQLPQNLGDGLYAIHVTLLDHTLTPVLPEVVITDSWPLLPVHHAPVACSQHRALLIDALGSAREWRLPGPKRRLPALTLAPSLGPPWRKLCLVWRCTGGASGAALDAGSRVVHFCFHSCCHSCLCRASKRFAWCGSTGAESTQKVGRKRG